MTILAKSIRYYFEMATRLYVWSLLSIYGIGKITGGQFHRKGHLPAYIAQTPLSEVGSFDLAWTFFGYSELYIYFIGISQLIGASMLLFERTKLVGVAILLPILVNIIVMDYCFSINSGALLSAISYLFALFFILYCNRIQVLEILQRMTQKVKTEKQETLIQKIMVGSIAIGIMLLMQVLHQQLIHITN